MLEMLKVACPSTMEKVEEDDELEMSLELSIGGTYASNSKKEKCNKPTDSREESNSEFSRLGKGQVVGKRKKELKLKSKGFSLDNDDDDDDTLCFLETKRSCSRGDQDRVFREKEELSNRKGYGFSKELSLSLGQVQCGYGESSSIESEQSNNNNNNGKRKNNNSKMVVSNNNNNNNNNGGSLEQQTSSSAVSHDYHTKGGNHSDTGSHSSPLAALQFNNIPRKSPLERPESSHSCRQTEPDRFLGVRVSQNGPNVASSSIIPPPGPPETRVTSPSNETNSGPVERPPKPPNSNPNASSLPRMPCVTTTGNGPNGKTITGVLYQYTDAEVSIMCVCHGSSFSPAGFVEHAGGINISHPLRHITIVPPR